ncbi:MAG: hypothetical protein JW782_02110 [Candidatus Saganbacteria bacterium]|nr:hypothetical protein [Candidatus Saganbacteria bacterium]
MTGPVQGPGGGTPSVGPVPNPPAKITTDGGNTITYGNPIPFTPDPKNPNHQSITEHMVPELETVGAPNGAPVDLSLCTAEVTLAMEAAQEAGEPFTADQQAVQGQLRDLQSAVRTTVLRLIERHQPALSGRLTLTVVVSGGTAPDIEAGTPGTPGGVTTVSVSTIDADGHPYVLRLPEGLSQEQLFDEIAGASAYVQTSAIPEGEEVSIIMPLTL